MSAYSDDICEVIFVDSTVHSSGRTGYNLFSVVVFELFTTVTRIKHPLSNFGSLVRDHIVQESCQLAIKHKFLHLPAKL